MYLRFIIHQINESSGVETGIFQIAYDLVEKSQLTDYETKRINELLNWFAINLKNPYKSGKFNKNDLKKSISWFKSNAHICIKKIYELIYIIEENGYFVECIKTIKPGRIKYEDDFQILAIPYKDSYR